MVESLKQLNPICQKPDYKKKGNWMVRHILRDAALPVTWLLLHTPVTANQVTLFSLGIGLLGMVYFAMPSSGAFWAGALLLQFWYYLDHVDGQIARYRKTASLTGRFYDFITHHIIHGAIFFALGFSVFLQTGHAFYSVLGFTASLSIMIFNLTHDTKYKTFFEKLAALKAVQITGESGKSAERPGIQTQSPARRFYSCLHKAAEIHVLMNILTLAAFLELFFFPQANFRFFLFLFYAFLAFFLAVTKVYYLIAAQKIDTEFNQTFREVSLPDL